MKKKSILTATSLLLCVSLLMACGPAATTDSVGDNDDKENAAVQEQIKNDIQEDRDIESEDIEETYSGDYKSSSALEETQETGTDMETASDGLTDEAAYSEESDVQIGSVQIGSVGTVEMTSLSSEESRAFEGKEMTADADYLEQAKSSDVYYCVEPLNRIEVHPIEQWAKDYSSYTISEEVFGRVESTEAMEPFRIFDVYPEGIPANCLVFWLQDGSCGTFSLGYNGSGEEHTWDNAIYKNYASMIETREKETEDGAVKWILNLYRDLAQNHHEQGYLNKGLLDGSIPSFGRQSLDYTGEPMYYSSECHFGEVCIGTLIPQIGIKRIDLNNDETDELIIGGYRAEDESSDDPTTLFAAYSVKDGEIQTIFQGWTRSCYYLAEDGSIIYRGSGGAMNYDIVKYYLTEDIDGTLSLQETEAVVVDGSTYPEEPYSYYPEGRQIVGYDDYGVPEYTFESVVQMDEETGRPYYDSIYDEAIHIDLEEFNLQEE